MNHKLIHLSDLHIGAGLVRRQRVDALVRHITTSYDPRYTTVCVTGDLTEGTLDPFNQESHLWEMEEACEALMPLIRGRFGLCVTPGNHDYVPKGATMVQQYIVQWYQEEVHDPLMPWASSAPPWLFRIAPWEYVIILDSMRGQLGPDIDLARGCHGPRQLQRLDGLLESLEVGVRVTIMQHHNTEYDRWTNALEDEEELMRILRAHSDKVALLLEGHEHRWRENRERWGLLKLGSGRSTDLHGSEGELQYYEIELGEMDITHRVISIPGEG